MPGGMPPMGGGMPQMPGGMPPMGGGMPQMPGGMPPMGGGMPQMPGGMPPMGSANKVNPRPGTASTANNDRELIKKLLVEIIDILKENKSQE
ncbi:MAG: hypothetical protein RRY24_03655, partial [Clostridiales bacterium]